MHIEISSAKNRDLENLEIARRPRNPFAVARDCWGGRKRRKWNAHPADEWRTESSCSSFHARNRSQFLAGVTNHSRRTPDRSRALPTHGHGHHEEIVVVKARVYTVQQNVGAPKQRRPNEQNQ